MTGVAVVVFDFNFLTSLNGQVTPRRLLPPFIMVMVSLSALNFQVSLSFVTPHLNTEPPFFLLAISESLSPCLLPPPP